MSKEYIFKNYIDAWEEVPDAPLALLTVATKPAREDGKSSASKGAPVDSDKLREALGFLDPNCAYDEWRDLVAGIGSANCPEARQIAHEWSEGKLDRLGRYNDALPSQYLKGGAEAVDLVLDTMPPKEGGIGVGTIERRGHDAGWTGTLAPRRNAIDIWKPDDIARIVGDSRPGETALVLEEDKPKAWKWRFYDAAADANLPPITFRDPNRLWMDNPDGTIDQTYSKPKHHKTGFILSEFFRLAREGKARVGYLGLEGVYGVRSHRLPQLARYYNVSLGDLNGPCFFQAIDASENAQFDLTNPECLASLAHFCRSNQLTDLIIDTQHRAAGNLDENSATDARVLWNAVDFLRRFGNVNVHLLHHAGKDANRGPRGSSADLASVDQQIELIFDRPNMMVTAKVVGRKDGPDGFIVPFKVHQDSEEDVPILIPMSKDEYDAASQDPLSPLSVGAALASLGCHGREKAVAIGALVTEILRLRDELPPNDEAQRAAIDNLSRQLKKRLKKDRRLEAYGTKEGVGRTSRWLWWLPENDGEGQLDD